MKNLQALALVGVTLPAVGQSVWVQQVLSTNPPPRDTHELATEPVSGRVVLFGGVLATNAGQLNDTWEWTGTAWSQAQPVAAPAARETFSIAPDGLGGIILFGGYTFFVGVRNDTWRYFQGQWTQMSPANQPSARRAHKAASRGTRILIFGGANASVTTSYDDTWEWDGGNWVPLSPAHRPPPRYGHAMEYDPVRDRVVLWGGEANRGAQHFSDTWEWNGVDWEQKSPATSPPSGYRAALAYSPRLSNCVLYGGASNSLPGISHCWTWDGTTWQQVPLSTPNPGPRSAPMAYAPNSQALLLFGGGQYGVPYALGDTWLSAPAIPATFSTFGSGCTGTGGTPTLAAAPGSLPRLGQTFEMTLSQLPNVATVAVGVLGFSTTFNNSGLGSYPLPASLGSIGMPGCTQYVSDEATFFLLSLTGQVNWPIVLPPTFQLAGVTFHAQGAGFDPQANALGVTTTNAGTGTIGS